MGGGWIFFLHENVRREWMNMFIGNDQGCLNTKYNYFRLRKLSKAPWCDFFVSPKTAYVNTSCPVRYCMWLWLVSVYPLATQKYKTTDMFTGLIRNFKIMIPVKHRKKKKNENCIKLNTFLVYYFSRRPLHKTSHDLILAGDPWFREMKNTLIMGVVEC